VNALKEKILRLIAQHGPIGIAQYMHMALSDPEHGYYMRGDPLGKDFITAPEVSQIFGELIGLFFVQAWEDRGRPKQFHLVEFGPGRGTLMADILRASRIRPAFREASRVSLIETSPVLKAKQQQTLRDENVTWIDDLESLADGVPIFGIANEFLDALPAHQFVKSERGWHARTVIGNGESLAFALTPDTVPPDFIPSELRGAAVGAVFEYGSEARAFMRYLAEHVVASRGAALVIDYGQETTSIGDTFQAVKAHGFADPLEEPGEADLTFHVDFEAIGKTAEEAGARVFGPLTQGAFLERLGIRVRGNALKRGSPSNAQEIDAAIDRLTSPEQMGTLFKVLAVASPGESALPGF
jgi:NADH dehydrogenase [ubiquinone] 1 alpha subcomplex assembly factor 7